MKKRTGAFLKQSLAVMTSLSLAFGPCAPGIRPAFGARTEAGSGKSETASASDASSGAGSVTASDSDALYDEDGFLVDGEVVDDVIGGQVADDVIEKVAAEPARMSEMTEVKRNRSEDNWYSDYEYELDQDAQTIILKKYTGEEDDIYVPATAEVDGTVYATVVENQGEYNDSVWVGLRDSLSSIAFENGVRLTGSASMMFSGFEKLESADLSDVDASGVTDMSSMFHGCSELESLDLSGMNVIDVTNMHYLFAFCSSLTDLDISGLDTRNVTDIGGMFYVCSVLKNIDLSGLDTHNVLSMSDMFSWCEGLEEIDLSGLDTHNVNDMSELFRDCPSLKRVDLSCLNMEEVSLMQYMFENCTSLESVNMSGVNTPCLANVQKMFKNCPSLKTVNMTGVDLSQISEEDKTVEMLTDCSSLEEFYVPTGLSFEVELPVTMYDGSGNVWTSVPQGLTESILLMNEISVTDVTLNTEEMTMEPGETFQLEALLQPGIATNKTVTWSSSDESVATVDGTGKVTAENTGSAVITVTTESGGLTAACTITVKIPVTGVEINTEGRTMEPGETFQLEAWPQPDTATSKAVTWSSSDPEVAAVDSTGLVTAGKEGTATVTATTVEGGYTAVCTITVRSIVESGTCGPDLTWTITGEDGNYTLTIEGQGTMEDYQAGEQPWNMFLEKTVKIQIGEGITGIGDNAFSGMDHIKGALVFPSSLQYLGDNVLDTFYIPLVFMGNAPVRADLKAESTYYYPLNDPTWEKSLRWELAPRSYWIGYREGSEPWIDGIDTETTNVVRYDYDSKWFGSYMVVNEDGNSDLTLTILGPVSYMHLNALQLQEYFFPSGIRTLIFGEQITGTIGKEVFSSYRKLRGDLTIPDGVDTIEQSAFELSGFDGKLKLPEGLQTIGKKAFYGCNFTGALEIPNGTVTVGSEAFSGNRFTTLVFKEDYVSINLGTYHSNPFQNIVFMGNAPVIDDIRMTVLADPDYKCYYPEYDPTWTWELVNEFRVYGGNEWIPFEQGTEPWNGYIIASGISLGTDSVSLQEGTETALSAAVLPEDASNKTVIWESADPSIASVDQNGVVTAVNYGTTTIRAMTWNRKYTAECRVSVFELLDEGTCGQGVSWQLRKFTTELTLSVSGSGKMDDYEYGTSPWFAYADEITRVEVGPGIRRIGNYAFDNFYELSKADIAEGVEEIGRYSFWNNLHIHEELVIPASVAKIEKGAFSGCYGFDLLNIQEGLTVIEEAAFEDCWDLDELTLPASLTYIGPRAFEEYKGDHVTYKGDWERLRNTEGFKNLPLDTVYCVYKDSFLPYSISEERVLIDLALDRDSITLSPGVEAVLNLSVSPEIAADYPVSWKSKNAQIAEVDNGIVRGIAPGQTVVYAYTDDEKNLVSCRITVTVPVTGVKLSKTTETVTVGESFTLKASVEPGNAANKNVVWSSSDPNIATVTAAGKVTGVKAGTAAITVKTVDGSKTASCRVTVKAKIWPVTGVTLNQTAKTMTVGESFTLTAAIAPSNAGNKAVTWSSSNTGIATVTAAGKVTGVKAGTATITVKTVDGGKTAACRITVQTAADPVEAFVKRLYTTCLGRNADPAGLSYWTGMVKNGTKKGIRLAGDFVFSKEFTEKNYCNEHFVRQLYLALMGRDPAADPSGVKYWTGVLDKGTTREALLNSFTSTAEYKKLCASAGIEPGSKISDTTYKCRQGTGTKPYGPCAVCGKKTKVVQFAERMYTECLGRAAEAGGLAYWSKGLYEKTITGRSIVESFFLSKEIKSRNLSNREYVQRIYKVMLNRRPDSGGLNYWAGRLDKGESPAVVIAGFINSTEFTRICDDYGIKRK